MDASTGVAFFGAFRALLLLFATSSSLWLLALPMLSQLYWDYDRGRIRRLAPGDAVPVGAHLALPNSVLADRQAPSVSHYISTPSGSGGMGFLTSPTVFSFWMIASITSIPFTPFYYLPLAAFTASWGLFRLTPTIYSPALHAAWVRTFGVSALLYFIVLLVHLRGTVGGDLAAAAWLLLRAFTAMALVATGTPKAGSHAFIAYESSGLLCMFWLPYTILSDTRLLPADLAASLS